MQSHHVLGCDASSSDARAMSDSLASSLKAAEYDKRHYVSMHIDSTLVAIPDITELLQSLGIPAFPSQRWYLGKM